MAKMTLLEMAQDILNDMDSDEVNSISDTTESLQVAQIIKTTYEEIMAQKIWPHLKSLFRLEGLSDTNTPTHTRLPEDVKDLDQLVSVRYNVRRAADTRDKYEKVVYKTIESFLSMTDGYHSSDTAIETITDLGGATIYIRNDRPPEFWTSFDDEHIIFSSYDSGVDTTIQSSKTQVVGYREAAFSMSDSFILDVPSKYFPMILAEAKSVCFNALKQVGNQKAEQQSQRQRRTMSQDGWRTRSQNRYPNYGRTPVGGTAPILHRNPLFDKD